MSSLKYFLHNRCTLAAVCSENSALICRWWWSTDSTHPRTLPRYSSHRPVYHKRDCSERLPGQYSFWRSTCFRARRGRCLEWPPRSKYPFMHTIGRRGAPRNHRFASTISHLITRSQRDFEHCDARFAELGRRKTTPVPLPSHSWRFDGTRWSTRIF